MCHAVYTSDKLTAEDCLAMVARGDDNGYSLLYKLLHDELYCRLRNIHNCLDPKGAISTDDSIDDFFLYLYENRQSLATIHNKESFFAWIVATYRNYLSVTSRQFKETAAAIKEINNQNSQTRPHTEILTDDQKIFFTAAAIAYIDQMCPARNKFLLYRWLLSFLDKSKAIANEEMATAAGMSYVAYRVNTHRQHARLLSYLQVQEQGSTLPLDETHIKMRNDLIEGFDNLYQTLLLYYEQSVSLHPRAQAIQQLRQHYDFTLHEDYSCRFSYTNFKNYLLQSISASENG